MNLYELIKKGESKTLELKEKLPSAINLAKTVIAFSNTAGGKIVIGVDNRRNIVGINEDEVFELQDKVISIIYDNCYPIILPELYTVNIQDKILLIIEIYRGSQLPYFLKRKGKLKGTYIRIGATNRIADGQIVIDLERQRAGKTFDEEINLDVEISELNLKPLTSQFEQKGKKIDKAKLKNLKLIKNFNGKDTPTNALLILIGYFNSTSIKCARFKGNSMNVFLDKKEFDRDLFFNLENTVMFLKNHLNLKAEIKGLKRTEEYEIPLEVLREILLNAIIHRDYTRNSDIKVAIYDDIIEIVSPGGLPNGLTIDELFNGRSELRNKVVARVFQELGFVETWGSGIKRIVDICREKDIRFEIKDEGSFVSVVFHRNIISKTDGKPAENQRKTGEKPVITLQEEKVLGLLKDKAKITALDIEKLLNVKSARAREILSKMVKKGLLKKIGKTKGSYYEKEDFE